MSAFQQSIQHRHNESGFTLIELSIVLVIIGLIVGGILVGQDLIKAAEVRSEISQIEKYNSAVNTFRSKFNAIPGDMPIAVANQFGFTAGTGCDGSAAGKRDGNGLIDGYTGAGSLSASGETSMFWQDISSAVAGNLIEGQFPNSGGTYSGCAVVAGAWSTTLGASFVGDFLPPGRLGHGTYVYVYNTGGYNQFGLSVVTAVTTTSSTMTSSVAIPVFQAYSIDKKVDDGLPTVGSVTATYLTALAVTNSTNAGSDSSTTCYNTSSNVYSVGSASNYGNGGNCALSFRFQ